MRNLLMFIFLLVGSVFTAEHNLEAGSDIIQTDRLKNEVIHFNSTKYELNLQAAENYNQEMVEVHARRSAVKAAFLSALIPGAGEVYAKSYWRAALFAGLEVALWTTNIIYENKGDDEDKLMRAFGDEHWSEHTYWSKLYKEAKADAELAGQVPDYTLDANNRLLDFNSEMANTLRFLERELGYTHSLPETKTQQYYEMIYKYLHQFGVGWDDVPFLEYYDNVANLGNPTPNIKEYRSMRNRSNDYYETASTMLNLVLLNHLLSAFDAAIAVKQFNKKFNYAVRVDRQYYGLERVTTYGLYLTL